jgi:hypothetical protein
MDSWDVQYSPSYGVALYLHAQEEEEEEEEEDEEQSKAQIQVPPVGWHRGEWGS